MNNLEKYTVLIQLISAVNISYIIPSIHQKVFNTIFDDKKFYHKRFRMLQNLMTEDLRALKQMEKITDKDIQEQSKNLIPQYEKIVLEIEDDKLFVKRWVDWLISRKGFKSLFLFTSLFCIIDIFSIAIISDYNESIFWKAFFYLITLIAGATILFLSYKTCLSEKITFEDNDSKYNRSIRFFTFDVLGSLVGAKCITLWFDKVCLMLDSYTNLTQWITPTVKFLAIGLPLYPCLYTFMFVSFFVVILKPLTWIFTFHTRYKCKGLHKQFIPLKNQYDTYLFNSMKWNSPNNNS